MLQTFCKALKKLAEKGCILKITRSRDLTLRNVGLFNHAILKSKAKFQRSISCFLSGILLLFSFALYAQENNGKSLVIVTSKSNEALTLQDVKRLYSLKQKFLPNKKRAKLTMLPIDGATTLEFTQSLYGLYPYQLQRIWDRAVFSGRGKAPTLKENTQTMLSFIDANNDALGYMFVDESERTQMEESYHVLSLEK
jgi:hypothetical protein